ncbi:MAG: radical SAM protein [Thermoproteota archaeon]
MSHFKVVKVRVSAALTRSGLPDLDYALNPYAGCSHGCVYCYARLYTRYREASRSWGRVVVVKENIVEVLKREVRRLKPGVVGVGTVTDPYQPVELAHRLTRRSLEVLLESGFYASIQTKSGLVTEDLDLLEEHSDKVDVGLTVTTLDERVAQLIEPWAPPPGERVRALEELGSRGIRVWVFYGPVLPGINDDDATLESIVRLAASLGAVLYYDKLRVRGFMLAPGYPIRGSAEAAKRYEWASFFRRLRELCARYGVECHPGFEGDARQEPPRRTLDPYIKG